MIAGKAGVTVTVRTGGAPTAKGPCRKIPAQDPNVYALGRRENWLVRWNARLIVREYHVKGRLDSPEGQVSPTIAIVINNVTCPLRRLIHHPSSVDVPPEIKTCKQVSVDPDFNGRASFAYALAEVDPLLGRFVAYSPVSLPIDRAAT
jgi:hypothetical protein